MLARRLWRRWGQHLAVVRPETVIRWHRQGWRLFWRWKSRPRLGRPRLSAEVRALIAAMARDNPRWGSERIRGELLKLGIRVSKRSVQRYRRRGPAHPPSQTWAADLCTVPTVAFRTLYVLFFITSTTAASSSTARGYRPPDGGVGLAATDRGDGVRLSLGGTIDDPADPMGKMFFIILATFAEFEVDLLRVTHPRRNGHRSRQGQAAR